MWFWYWLEEERKVRLMTKNGNIVSTNLSARAGMLTDSHTTDQGRARAGMLSATLLSGRVRSRLVSATAAPIIIVSNCGRWCGSSVEKSGD